MKFFEILAIEIHERERERIIFNVLNPYSVSHDTKRTIYIIKKKGVHFSFFFFEEKKVFTWCMQLHIGHNFYYIV